jgi:hypothetical protein
MIEVDFIPCAPRPLAASNAQRRKSNGAKRYNNTLYLYKGSSIEGYRQIMFFQDERKTVLQFAEEILLGQILRSKEMRFTYRSYVALVPWPRMVHRVSHTDVRARPL